MKEAGLKVQVIRVNFVKNMKGLIRICSYWKWIQVIKKWKENFKKVRQCLVI